MAQASDCGLIELFNLTLDAPRTPDLNTPYCIMSRPVEITQIIKRGCQSHVGLYQWRRLLLLSGERVNVFGNPQRRSHLLCHERVAPLTNECHKHEIRPIKRLA